MHYGMFVISEHWRTVVWTFGVYYTACAGAGVYITGDGAEPIVTSRGEAVGQWLRGEVA